MADIWNLVNQPLSVLLIGSGLGWLFLKFIWEPYQASKTRNERTEKYKAEAEFRLITISYDLREQRDAKDVVYGLPNNRDFILPEFQRVTLFALIAGGWGTSRALEYFILIRTLVFSSEKESKDPQRRQRAEDALARIAGELGFILPAAD